MPVKCAIIFAGHLIACPPSGWKQRAKIDGHTESCQDSRCYEDAVVRGTERRNLALGPLALKASERIKIPD